MYRILIADEHPIVRIGLKNIIDKEPGFTIADEALSREDMYDKIKENQYHAVLFDILISDNEGIETIKDIKKLNPNLPILIYTVYPEDQYAVRSIKAGASAYVNKNSKPDELMTALTKLVTGGKYITPGIAERLVACFSHSDSSPVYDRLTDREFQIMRLIASGVKLRDIAERLSLSVNTINSYRIYIMGKMGFKSNVELTHYAIKHRLVD